MQYSVGMLLAACGFLQFKQRRAHFFSFTVAPSVFSSSFVEVVVVD
jgi:hypothetical protein